MKRPLVALASLVLIAIAAPPLAAGSSQSSPAAPVLETTGQSSAEVDMNAAPNLSADGIRQVQQALQRRGFDPGPIDGIYGPLTKGGVSKFQDFYGIKATGEINNQTLYALGMTQLAGR
jgi:peptidoglycan hydrolase-like protein with peptidoglycan-binding domain